MEDYSVKIFSAAQDDLRSIVEYLNTLSYDTAMQYYTQLLEIPEILTTAPEIRPLAKDMQLRLRGYRTLPVKEFIIFYVIKEKTVELRRILFAKKQYDTLIAV